MDKVYYKWVSPVMKTMNNTHWKLNIPKELPEKEDLRLCCPGLYHYYEHPLLAITFKNMHVGQGYTKLCEVRPEGKIVKGWDKCGCTKLTLVKETNVPSISVTKRVAFGILCSLKVCEDENYIKLAKKWLSGEDRYPFPLHNYTLKNNTKGYIQTRSEDVYCSCINAVNAIKLYRNCFSSDAIARGYWDYYYNWNYVHVDVDKIHTCLWGAGD